MVAFLFPGQGKNANQPQVEIFKASLASYEARVQSGEKPDMVVGLSLGEFGALCAAGTLEYQSCLGLLARRQALTDEACRSNLGAMAAILGMDSGELAEICSRARGGGVWIANYNCPGQLVISGTLSAVEETVRQVNGAGARAIRLKVAGPFHSPLMEEANSRFAEALESVALSSPQVSLYSSVSGERETETDRIRELLMVQMASPVLFEHAVRSAIRDGAAKFVEMEPAGTLGKLVSKILS